VLIYIYIHTTYTYAQYTQQICSIMQDKSLAPLPSGIYIIYVYMKYRNGKPSQF
jgi:hypothetical protein